LNLLEKVQDAERSPNRGRFHDVPFTFRAMTMTGGDFQIQGRRPSPGKAMPKAYFPNCEPIFFESLQHPQF